MDYANRTEAARLWLAGDRNNDIVKRGGFHDGNLVSLRSMGVGEATKGAKAIPENLADVLIAKRDLTNVVRSVSSIVTTLTGVPMLLPTVDDVANAAELKGENDQATEETDIVISSVELNSYVYSARCIMSRELLTDAGPGVQRALGNVLGQRVGRAINAALTTGTGTDQPQGVVTGATIAKTVAADDAVTYVDLCDAMAALGDAYHEGAVWMMNRATLTSIAKIVDGAQRPVFNIENGTLFGKRVVVNSAMPSMAADAKPIIFFDGSCYAVREVESIDIKYMVEERAIYHQAVVSAYSRCDGRYLDAAGAVALRMAGS